MQLLRRALRQVDEPVLAPAIGGGHPEAGRDEQKANAALERAETLTRMELFAEAVVLLEEQSPGVKRLPRVDQALGRARKLQEAEAEFAALTGRCYAQMGTAEGIADLKRALNIPANFRCSSLAGGYDKTVASTVRAGLRGKGDLRNCGGPGVTRPGRLCRC